MRATARPVCLAFVNAMRVYGVPEEVLTDNGKVFTGRFHKPGVPVEVLFDQICRENGITHRLTKIHSPTTTGKIERLHQTLQRELLDVHGPFASIEALQAALDTWRGRLQHRPPAPVAGHGLPRQPVHASILAAGAAHPGPAHGEHRPAEPPPARRLRCQHRPARAGSVTASRLTEALASLRWRWTGWSRLGELVDRRPAGLARPRPVRAARHPLGRCDQPARAAGRCPDQDASVPARGH